MKTCCRGRRMVGGAVLAWLALAGAGDAQTATRSRSQPQADRPASQPNAEMSWPMPPKIRFCDPTHCGTLTSRNGRYDAVYDDGSGQSFYAVELIAKNALTFHRVDQDGRTAVLKGKLSPQGNRIDEGTMTWDDGTSVFFNIGWGSAFDAVVRPRPRPALPPAPGVRP